MKHSFYDSHREANLLNTVSALTGLFLLNVLHQESRKYLIWKRVIVSGDIRFPEDMRQVRTSLWDKLRLSYFGVPKSVTSYITNCRAVTPLSLHMFREDPNA